MSYNHPYRNPPDDFNANNDKFKISQQIHPRDSNAYMSRIRNTSSEQTSLSSSEMSIFPPGKALSFLHSCGLDTEDLKTLAELPEHLITADALPDLLAEIKKKKISRTTSSRSSALQASTSTRSWDDRSHTQSVEYSLDLPIRQSDSLNREQVPTWDDRWGNVQQTSSQTRTYTSSEPNYVVEYNHLKDNKSYFDNVSSYATEPSRQKISVVPQSYGNYSRDISQSSNMSSRDISQSSHRSGRNISQSSHLSSRDVSQSSHLFSRDVSQTSHLSSRDFSQSSHLSSRDIALPSLLSSRDVGPPSVLSSRDIGSHSLSRRDIVPPSNLSSRDIGPPLFLSSRDIGLPSLLSIRDLAPPSRLSSRDASQSSHQRRKPVIHIVPTRKEASDFHGKTPPVFPYACVLCEITVLSNKDWSVHVKGPQHANSQLSLVEKYPEWDQTIQSARRNEPGSESSKSRTTQERGGTSSSRNGSSGSKIRASSSKSESSSSKNLNQTQATTKCKVVCVIFEVDEVDEAYLKKLLGQFGAIVKIIMFPKLAFVEMGTAGQAEDIVKYFLHNPLWVRGEMIQFSLSAAFSFLQTKPSVMDTSKVQSETSECVPTATTSDRSSDCREAQELQQGEQKELQQGEQKELQQGEQKELQQGEQKELQQGKQKELQQGEQKELQQGEQKDETEEKEEKATDFPGNLENLPTSDEFEEVLTEQGDEMEISASVTEEKYGKVLEVGGFPVAKKYSEKDLLKIGEKYGDVADCCLVRSNRKVEKALIEMVDADAAAKLEAESKRQRIRLGGKILKITMSKTYSQVNKGVDSVEGQEHAEEKNEEPSCSLVSSEESTVVMAETETSEEAAEAQKETNTDAIMQMSSDEEEVYGRVLRIRNLPMPDEYTDADFLSIAEPYGKIKRHWMFRLHRTGLIEMEKACDAEKVVSAANMNKITVAGNHPKVSVSTKHAHLNKRYFLHGPSDGSIQTSTELEKEFWSDNQDVDSKEDEKQVSDVDGGNGMEVENSDSVSKAQTQMMDPVGTEFVRPVVGYFCSLCNAIYASEEEAKNDHCRTPLHHQKLKEHKERNSS